MIQKKVMGVPVIDNATKRKNSENMQICRSACGLVYHMPGQTENDPHQEFF